MIRTPEAGGVDPTVPIRLGVYVDDVYHIDRSVPPRATSDRAFLLFVCEVGRRFDALVLFGRTLHDEIEGDYALPSTVELAELRYYDSLGTAALLAMTRALRDASRAIARVDVLWIFGPHPFGFALAALALARGKRVVLGVRSDGVEYFRSRMAGRGARVLLGAAWAMDRAHRWAARQLPTTVVGAELAAQYEGGRAPVLPMAVSLVSQSDVEDGPRCRDWSGTIELLSVGRLDVEKNPGLLVDMLLQLEEADPGRYRLTIVGRGPLEGAVRAQVADAGLEPLVDFRGYVPFGGELLACYRAAHVFVHVSLTEGLPQVLMEAMATATPVVATDVGGVRAALDDGGAGILVSPSDSGAIADAVVRISSDGALRDALVSRGLEIARATTREREAGRVAMFLRDADRPRAVTSAPRCARTRAR